MKQALQVPYRNLSLYGDMVLHAADGIPQEPKVHTRPLLPSELFYSMTWLTTQGCSGLMSQESG